MTAAEQWAFFLDQFATPGKLVGHLSYVLLIASMLMRSMKRLRIVAVSAGVVSALYGYFWLRDYVTVFWEVIFVATNLGQLLLIEWENRRAQFSADEDRFIAKVLPDVERAHAKRLLRIAEQRSYEADDRILEEGQPVPELIFVLEGAVRIDKDGQMVGVCGHDDFLGEIGFMLGSPASATAVATHGVRCLVFERVALARALQKDMIVRHALEASFNRNLVEKLVKSNTVRSELNTA